MSEEVLFDASNNLLSVDSVPESTTIHSHLTTRRFLMADTTTYTADPSYLLLQGEADIRSDIKAAESHIRSDVTKAEADIRQDVTKAEADVRYDIAKGEADVRHDIAKSEADVRQEVAAAESELKGLLMGVESDLKSDIKESQFELVKESFKMHDRTKDQATQYFISTSDKLYRHQADMSALRASQDANFAKVASDANHLAERVIAHNDLSSERLAYKMLLDGDKTRELINGHFSSELQRKLSDSRNEIADLRSACRHSESQSSQFQTQAIMSQLQAFQSDLQSTKQGMINLGTMTGTTQTSNPTSIR